MNMPNEELKQLLLELHYGLLDNDEAIELRSRIDNEPEVAATWDETLQLAGKLASAAKVDGATLPDILIPPTSPTTSDLAQVEQATTTNSRRFWISSIGLLATAASIGFLILGSRYLQQLPDRPDTVVRMDARAAIAHRATADNEFEIQTSLINGTNSLSSGFQVIPATISFSIFSGNSVLFRGDARTSDEGVCKVTVPDELVLPEGSKLSVTATPANGAAASTVLEIPLEPTRCLTYVKTDRPVYRPGETVYFRSVTLNRRSLAAHVDVPIHFELTSPDGAVVDGAAIEGVTDRGVGGGSFTIPSTAPGGPYQLVAKSMDGFFPDEIAQFNVRVYRVPRFKKKLEFQRRSYGPGDTVEADFSAQRAEGGPVAGASVRVQAIVDEKLIYQSNATTSASGELSIAFPLPEHIDEGVGRLSISLDDGGVQETQSKTIPIQLGRVAVDFYPEGGYLVDGLLNRVYFAARNSVGDPIHIEGEVLARNGTAVATITTTRDGMGRFSFVPEHGQRYSLKVTSPVDVTNLPKLPSVMQSLPVLETGTGVFAHDASLSLAVRHTQQLKGIVRAVCRGQLVGERQVDFQPGSTDVELPIRSDAAGVIRVTVLDASKSPAQPLVERLVYRREHRRLKIAATQDESELQKSPGESLRLTLQVTDENDNPTPAVLGVRVVDESSLSLDETERPTLRSHFLLTSEVEKPEDLEHANFYLSDDPEAAESLDLLLGTQGWRRFVSGSPDQSSVDFRQQLVRLLELDGTTAAAPKPPVSNAAVFVDQWSNYRIELSLAWKRFLHEARLLSLVLLGLFFVAVLIHRVRRTAVASAMLWMIIASSALAVIGCGGQGNVVVESASGLAAPEMSADEAKSRYLDSEMADMNAEEHEIAQSDVDPRSAMGSPGPPSETSPTKPEDRIATGRGEEFDVQQAKTLAVANDIATNRMLSPEQLQRFLSSRGLDAQSLADQLMDELRFPVRQYAHRYKKAENGIRADFTETLLWQPMLVTDSKGQATVRFDLSDQVTSFRIDIDGHSVDGRIGSGSDIVTSRIPFQIEPKLPLEVTTGDRIDLPVAVINATVDDISVKVDLEVGSSLERKNSESVSTSVQANGRTRLYFPIDVGKGQAEQDVAVRLQGIAGSANGDLSDSITRTLRVSPSGYPARQSIAGRLNGRDKITLPIPGDIVAGSLAVTLRAYPSPVADLMAGVESILREPHGCFEQTSATNYPNAMALQYLQKNQLAKPEISRRARALLDKGYGKLTSFECQQRGYEWFGKDPGHEALSAFGLMQFSDMQNVMDIDAEMVLRTRKWLLSRRDGKGGFKRNPRHLHVWSVDQTVVNAYVLWAITEADVASGQPQRTATELADELQSLDESARQSDDAYLIALSAAALMNAQMTDQGIALLEKLAKQQADDGSLDGKTTVVSSGGISRKVETTAIATLAWLKSKRHLSQARSAATWLTNNRQGSAGFGSTQATVLALKALVAMSDHTQSSAGKRILVKHNGKTIGQAELPQDVRGGEMIEIGGLAKALDDLDEPAEIEIVADGSSDLSYTIDLAYHAITPDSNPKCPLGLSTQWRSDSKKITAGDTINVRATVENTSDDGLPMTVAIVGLPGGVEPKTEQLDELQKAERFDFYELRGREVVFYWRTLSPNSTQQIDFTVTATVPGKYTGPASRTYLYYTAEQKTWMEPLKLVIGK